MRATTAAEQIRAIPAKLASAKTEGPLRKFVEMAVGELGRAMVRGQSPDGSPYRPLKRKRPPGHNQQSGPLIDTGEMMRSLIADGPGHIEIYEHGQVRLGTSNEKAAKHQYGTGNIPARPFVGYTAEMIDAAAEIAADHALEVLRF